MLRTTPMSGKQIDFYFDLSSPYSYFAATQLDAIAGPSVRGCGKPMVLAAVFKAVGNVMPAVCIPKAQYMVKDLARWAAHYGVPFQMSSRFPLPTIRAMRFGDSRRSAWQKRRSAKRFFFCDGNVTWIFPAMTCCGRSSAKLACLLMRCLRRRIPPRSKTEAARLHRMKRSVVASLEPWRWLWMGSCSGRHDRLHFLEQSSQSVDWRVRRHITQRGRLVYLPNHSPAVKLSAWEVGCVTALPQDLRTWPRC